MKKSTRRILSIACAALMSAQLMAVNVSADDDHLYYYNGRYYEYPLDAYNAAGGAAKVTTISKNNISTTGMTVKYYVNGVLYDTIAQAEAAGGANPAGHAVYIGTPVVNSGSSSSTGSSTYRYYSLLTKKYYTTYADALAASGGLSEYVTDLGTTGTTGYYYYSSYTNKYYTTYAAALAASGGNSAYVSYRPYYGISGTSGYYYYSSYTNKYYTTYAAALAASGGNSAYVSYRPYYTGTSGTLGTVYRYYYNGVYYPTLDDAKKAGGTALGVDIFYRSEGVTGDTTNYYYYKGTYYGSLQAAIDAGGTALGVDISYVPYNYYGIGSNSYYNGYYYNGYYYYNGGLIDPYYAYSQLLNSSSSSSSDKEAADGEPYIYGKKTKAGWSTIVKYINAASSGTSLAVDMNGSYVVDDSVLDALDGKNVSVTFVLDNGVKWTINGKKITKPQDINIYTQYNIRYIPDRLVNKAASGAVSKAQIGVSTDFNSLGTDANVTVKFSTKRSGCTAVVYRYDPDTNSLKGVCKSKVQTNGSCTFTVDAGGPYLIVLK